MQTYRKTRAGGGWPAILYALEKAMEVGPWRLWKKMSSRNACKTCAVGMGGQLGGMVNETGHFPEVCKKSLQAQAADMKAAILPEFFDEHDLDSLIALTPKQCEDAGRLTFPLMLAPGASHFQPVNWQAALEIAAGALRAADPKQTAFYSSGRSSNEAGFLLQSFARVYGTNNVMNCSFFCHQASGVALKMALGSGTATVQLEDLAKADLVFMCGSNPASNHPRVMTLLADLRERGGQVIVVNPVREPGLETFHIPSQLKSLIFGSRIASLYVQPYAGGDVAFFVGVLKALIECGKVNQEFLDAHTTGADPVLAEARAASWEAIESCGGVLRAQIEEVAAMLAGSRSTVFCWAMGLTQHENGVDNVLALCNLALASGQVGREGAGMLPMRGHSNVQGVGSIGVTPQLQEAARLALERVYGRQLPTQPGYDTYAMVEAAEAGKIDVLIALGGNLWGSNPDSERASRALQSIKTTVYLSTKLNPGHFQGRGQTTLILPVLARDEEPQATTQESMFNFVRLSEGGEANLRGNMRAESEIICDLATLVLGKVPVDWSRMRSHREIRRLISEVVPGWQEIAQIDDTKREFTIQGRILHSPKFNTDDGRARMYVTPLPPAKTDVLRLITLRSEGQFNTVVYEEPDLYRGIPHRHCILVSGEDATRLEIADGQRVTVRGEAGTLQNIEVVLGKIRPGVVAMFYPESNLLIKGHPDKRSKTPAFKSAPVWIDA